ncbi:MAG: DUF2283 domain-containing protein [Moorella humiferrea]|uniref:DUF2283 domain-containing protein n=1 Tax=Neomoorella humiferrea TaxID=676965 RepID=UPI0019DB4215|nr:DUF2283 domain-containing protein [Moorella humiferrea]
MRFHYYADTDSLYIDLSEKESADSVEVAPGIVLDFDAEGNLVGIDIDQASKRIDLSRLETEGLPLGRIMVIGPGYNPGTVQAG